MNQASKEKAKKVVDLVELKVLLNPKLIELLKILNKCKVENCAMCREIKDSTGINTKF